LPYTRAVVKETLRYRPPVIMVPYIAKKDFPITDSYTVPKGTFPLHAGIGPQFGRRGVPYNENLT